MIFCYSWFLCSYVLLINALCDFYFYKATPFEYGHVYLVPCTSNRLYQHLDARSVEIVTRMAAEIHNQSFRVFYDSCRANRSDVYFQVLDHL